MDSFRLIRVLLASGALLTTLAAQDAPKPAGKRAILDPAKVKAIADRHREQRQREQARQWPSRERSRLMSFGQPANYDEILRRLWVESMRDSPRKQYLLARQRLEQAVAELGGAKDAAQARRRADAVELRLFEVRRVLWKLESEQRSTAKKRVQDPGR